MIVTIPAFYYFLWITFFEGQEKYLAYCTLFLGLSNQGSIHTIYLWFSVLLAYWYIQNKRIKRLSFKPLDIIKAVGTYLISVSSIILAQGQLLLAGIYPSFEEFVGPPGISQKLLVWIDLFGGLGSLIVSPFFPLLSLVLLAVVFVWFLRQDDSKLQRVFILIVLLSPLSLLALQERQNYHFLIGLSPILLILLTLFLQNLNRQFLGKSFVWIFILFYVFNAIAAREKLFQEKNPYYQRSKCRCLTN